MLLARPTSLVLAGLLMGAVVGPRPLVAQNRLVLDVRAGGAIPVGSLKTGPLSGGDIDGGPGFGLLFDLRTAEHVGIYVGFTQLRFGCADDGCAGDQDFVTTSWDLGAHVHFGSTTWTPWLRLGLSMARVEWERAGVEGIQPAVSDLGIGGEVGVGMRIRISERFGVNPGVRFGAVDTRLESGELLQMRYWLGEVGWTVAF